MNDMMLYAPYLFRTEEEFFIFHVSVDFNFWEAKDIETYYNSLFNKKLVSSIEDMIENIVKEQFEYDELAEAFQESFLKKPNSDARIHSVKEKIHREYEEFLDYISDLLNTDKINFTSLSSEDLGQAILFDYYGFGPDLAEFTKRLKIIQHKGDLTDYYLNEGMIESKKEAEDFPTYEQLKQFDFNENDFRSLTQTIICD